jgi:hypothetical protein
MIVETKIIFLLTSRYSRTIIAMTAFTAIHCQGGLLPLLLPLPDGCTQHGDDFVAMMQEEEL